MLTLENVTHIYPNGTKALDNVSLSIPKDMFGLLGPSGAGKSILKAGKFYADGKGKEKPASLTDNIEIGLFTAWPGSVPLARIRDQHSA